MWEHSFANDKGEIIPAPIIANWPLVLLTTATFEADGERTRLTLTWTPLDATDSQRETFEGMKPSMTQGWSGSFEQLDDYLAQARE